MNTAPGRSDDSPDPESSEFTLRSPALRGWESINADPYGSFISCFLSRDETGAYCVNVTSTDPQLPNDEQFDPTFSGASPFTVLDGFRLNSSECGLTVPVPQANVSACNSTIDGPYTYGENPSDNPAFYNNYVVQAEAAVCRDASGAYPPLNSSVASCFFNKNLAAAAAANALYPALPPAEPSGLGAEGIGGVVAASVLVILAICGIGKDMYKHRCTTTRSVSHGDGAAYVPVPVPNEP